MLDMIVEHKRVLVKARGGNFEPFTYEWTGGSFLGQTKRFS